MLILICHRVGTVLDRWANVWVLKSDLKLESLKTDSKSRSQRFERPRTRMHLRPHRIPRTVKSIESDRELVPSSLYGCW